MHKLFIFGASSFAQIAGEYFYRSGEYEVLGHLVDPGYKNEDFELKYPVYETGTAESELLLKSASHFFVAVTYLNVNRYRTKKYLEYKNQGKIPASYISERAYIDPETKIGEHCFIFENNVIQLGVTLGNNCVLWSGNHIGHHSKLGDNLFISSHVVISGHTTIGDNSFFGVNSTIYNNLEIGSDNWIGPNSVISKSTNDNVMMRGALTPPSNLGTKEFFKLND